MPISSNSIIHYTKTLDVLLKILEEGFKVSYCYENIVSKIEGAKIHKVTPMISFCDIPFSNFKNQIDSYGSYGIGLSKKWATRNQLNPVLYLDSNSKISDTILKVIKKGQTAKRKPSAETVGLINSIMLFVKDYEGLLERDGTKIENYRYYDEREWRYVPEEKDLKGAKLVVKASDYKSDKEKFNKSIDHIRITFTPEDISYIIVEKVDEIEKTISFLRDKFYDKYTIKVLDILLSKIISCDQIANDF